MKPPGATLLAAALLIGCGAEPPSPATATALEVPAAPGSIAPNLAAGANGPIVISWIEPEGDGHSLRFSVLADDGWQAPASVTSGDNWFVNWADFPSVVPVSDDLWAAHWLVSQPEGGYAYDVNVAMTNDRGANWSEPFLPHFDKTPTEHGFVTLFPDSGGVGLVWLDGRQMVNEYDENDPAASGMTLRSATFGEDLTPIRSDLVDALTCDCCQTDVALTPDGPIVVYRNRTEGEIRDIFVSRREFGEWQPGTAVAVDGWKIDACPVNGPVIRANGDTVAVAWFTAAQNRPRIQAAWSSDRGKTFSTPVEVSSDRPLGYVGATLTPDDDLLIVWQRRTGEGQSELVLRRVATDSRASEPYVVDSAADVFSFSVPQLAMRGDDAVLAWTNAVDDAYSIGSTLIPISLLGQVTERQQATSETDALAAVFSQRSVEAAMIIESLDGDVRHVYNESRANTRFSPASTFKLPNTLIALDRGIVDSKDSVFEWDGEDRGVAQWNRDQTLASALQVSCVWCYQEIAREVGHEHYRRVLSAIQYGNGHTGDEVDQFWLNGDLEISAQEQIAFLRDLVRDVLPFEAAHVDTLEDIMIVDESDAYTLHAKSGWTGADLAVGWYVGFVKTGNDTYLFAMNMHLDNAEAASLRKELALQALAAVSII